MKPPSPATVAAEANPRSSLPPRSSSSGRFYIGSSILRSHPRSRALPFALYLPSMSRLSFSAPAPPQPRFPASYSRGVFPPICTTATTLPTFRPSICLRSVRARSSASFLPSSGLLRLPMAALWYQSSLVPISLSLKSAAFRLKSWASALITRHIMLSRTSITTRLR